MEIMSTEIRMWVADATKLEPLVPLRFGDSHKERDLES